MTKHTTRINRLERACEGIPTHVELEIELEAKVRELMDIRGLAALKCDPADELGCLIYTVACQLQEEDRLRHSPGDAGG